MNNIERGRIINETLPPLLLVEPRWPHTWFSVAWGLGKERERQATPQKQVRFGGLMQCDFSTSFHESNRHCAQIAYMPKGRRPAWPAPGANETLCRTAGLHQAGKKMSACASQVFEAGTYF